MGIGQSGLLVMLPQLVHLTGLSLSVWAGLLMFGSMLFLPTSPWWGRQAEQKGCKPVVIYALSGFLLSFGLIALIVWGMASAVLTYPFGLTGLIISRVIYGCTVSGMVPAAQTWAMQRAGSDKRMSALATISSGLSGGRLLGPPLAAMTLNIHPMAPLWLIAIAPLLALIYIAYQNNDPPLTTAMQQITPVHWTMWPPLMLAVLLAASISLMQLGLAPHLKPLLVDTLRVSQHIATMLSLAAASTLAAQFLVVRPQRLGAMSLLIIAALMLVAGLGLMVSAKLFLIYTGISVASFGAAMATPAYQLLLSMRLSAGKAAGAIATSHTLGYGLSALLVPLVAVEFGDHALLTGSLFVAVLFLMLSGWLFMQYKQNL